MSIICPSVTPATPDPHLFREQIDRVKDFATRIQIDLMDGDFAPHKNINPIQIWWPENISADIHLMYRYPAEHLETLISLKPSLIILHAEAEGDIAAELAHIKKFGIASGVALLQDTAVESVQTLIEIVDHVLIFAGNLGEFGGQANMSLLSKVNSVRAIKQNIEVGWDGGANLSNVTELVAGGVDVINVGGAIQRADNPAATYHELVARSV